MVPPIDLHYIDRVRQSMEPLVRRVFHPEMPMYPREKVSRRAVLGQGKIENYSWYVGLGRVQAFVNRRGHLGMRNQSLAFVS